jgi:hypothetical protein
MLSVLQQRTIHDRLCTILCTPADDSQRLQVLFMLKSKIFNRRCRARFDVAASMHVWLGAIKCLCTHKVHSV